MSNSKMVRLCYSDPQLAFAGGLDFLRQEEETVYVCKVVYPSGVEYHLKKTVMPCHKPAASFELKKSHKFRSFEKALKAISYFRDKGKRLCVKKKYKEENGYKFIKYYYLCSM